MNALSNVMVRLASRLLPAVALIVAAMTEAADAAPGLATGATMGEAQWPARFGIGRPATDAEISRWDIDVAPDGADLPPGRGTAAAGASIYAEQCAVCHGQSGTEGPYDRLVTAAGEPFPSEFGASSAGHRTIGNYWPYATTLFDYIRRAMPLTRPGSLGADEVYALTAYLLYRNGILEEATVLDARTLAAVLMPARDRFVPDDRRDDGEVR